jgi:nucleotide-binding universal stress UspA family protein
LHRGASRSGGPAGERNGQYRHGERTKAGALLKLLRVTAFAMPILKRASRVVVLTVEGGAAVPGPTGEQLCRYLQLNEVPAKPRTVGPDGRLTGEVILAHANALGCDLLIKGAHTQSRLRQMIFGSTTRYILSNAQLPVLMVH